MWSVVVEANRQGNRDVSQWQVTHYEQVGTLAAAQDRALVLARGLRPERPRNPRSRLVFRAQDGSLLVHIEGAVSSWHFRVSVLEFVGAFDSTGQALT
ncbi:hypothetical protein [Actinokineospora pegani]|uniref:hypothetical protein n=1 Tax=Actinokineospora pegani TaxID=2654637 RepID=UPI0012EA43D0|nr:hypothetical protein [Actinokineospora pegani]